MSNPAIETYRGRLPTCRGCGRQLRPNYKTVTRTHMEEAKYKRVMLGSVDKNDEYRKSPEHDPYANYLPWPFPVEWDEQKGQFFRLMEVGRIKSRRFKGTFGAEGNGFFCSVRCGFRWAVRTLAAQ